MPHADEEPNDGNDDGDSNGSKDDGESLVEGEPPAKKGRLDESGKNRHPLIAKLTKTLQLTEHVGPAIDGDLASHADKIMREKASEDKITHLKKQPEIPENCSTLSETKVNQGVWNNLDESARSTDLKFQKVQKSLVKGIIIIVTEVNKMTGNSGPQNAVGSLMDGVLLMANANQELNYRRRELMRPQLKDGAYYCYCAYVLRISRYSDFLSPMLTNTRIFLRGLKLSGESRSS